MQNKDLSLPLTLYAEHLEDIGGIKFTPREIDVISCIISGRTSKKIASFLSISPKTIDNHTYNIKRKLGGGTRDRMIDFIEKSGKMLALRKYYSSLLTQTAFEHRLKKISRLVNHDSPVVFIAPLPPERDSPLLPLLEEHLRLAGINVVFTSKDVSKGLTDGVKNTPSPQLDPTLKRMSDDLFTQLSSPPRRSF